MDEVFRVNASLQEHVLEHAGRLVAAYEALDREMKARELADRARFHLAAIIESAEDAIVSETLDGTILTWNPGAERLFGYAAAEIVGTSVYRLLPPGQEAEELAILQRIKEGLPIEHFESLRQRKDMTLVPVSLTVSPVRNDAGRIIGASKIARDLTDQRQFEAQATLVAQLQKALAELKTLRGLIPICGYCKKVRDDSGFWQQVEIYLHERTEAQFSHGICPSCLETRLQESPSGTVETVLAGTASAPLGATAVVTPFCFR